MEPCGSEIPSRKEIVMLVGQLPGEFRENPGESGRIRENLKFMKIDEKHES